MYPILYRIERFPVYPFNNFHSPQQGADPEKNVYVVVPQASTTPYAPFEVKLE